MNVAVGRMLRWIGLNVRTSRTDWFLRLVHTPYRRPEDAIQDTVSFDRGRIHIDTSSWIEWYIYFHGVYGAEMRSAIEKHVPDGGICLDIGANIGCHTLEMAWRVGPLGRVHAFEPSEKCFTRLRANVELNHLQNVTLHRVGISDKTAEKILYVECDDDPNKGKASLHPRPDSGLTVEQRIKTSTIADLPDLQALERLDFVKIDTEGHELIVLRQLRPLLERLRPKVAFEYQISTWRSHQATLDEAFAVFKEVGFDAHVLQSGRRVDLPADVDEDRCDLLIIPR